MSTLQPVSLSDVLSDRSGPLIPSRKVQKRYGVTDRTLDRWLGQPDLEFPKPVVINRRRYFYESELLEFERSRTSRR